MQRSENMTRTQDSTNIVVVTGDLTVDWNIARSRHLGSDGSAWNADDCSRVYWQRGGAALIGDLIEAVVGQLQKAGKAQYTVRQTAAPREPVRPGDEQFHHSYAMWSAHRYGAKPPLDSEKSAWRVEEFLGLDRGQLDGGSSDWMSVQNDAQDASVVVLDDADLGFRSAGQIWPKAITEGNQRPWVVLKSSRPVAQGKLWQHLSARCPERLIVIMTVNDLRLSEVQISRELSWERTAQDVAWELTHNPRINALSRCAHVVVSFDTAGAVLLSGGHCRLFFDPKVIEGMWEQAFPGGMVGYTSTLTAGVVRELLLSPVHPDIPRGIASGLGAMRKLHTEGYGERGSNAHSANLAFPTASIVTELEKGNDIFADIEVRDPLRSHAGFWAILEDRYTENLNSTAQRIVLEGAEPVLKGVPLGQFGGLLTVDRGEIEAFRSIRTLVAEYSHQGKQKRPLNIAVFGAPGSGKSFGITEVAKSLLPGQIQVLEFNLSQLGRPADLLQALHQVRDIGLSGALPLVFWDEFDTALDGEKLGWLRYFLAPMQDGKFQEGQIGHPIGRSIFVFAGGTSTTLEKFGQGLASEEFRAAKGPDFVSRLKGYVNILGPNPQARTADDEHPVDPFHVIRRGILLRSIFQRTTPQLLQNQKGKKMLNIDSGVLRAFLETREFKHGVRSMESVIAMSLLSGKGRYERSCLPSEAQLDLHVNARDFLALVQRIDLEGDLLEKMASAAHDLFCETLRAKGYQWGDKTDDANKVHSALKPYADLPEDEKEQNRSTVRDIPLKLSRADYVMIPARSSEAPFDFPGADLELLAEMEHARWLKLKITSGWRWAAHTDKPNRLHKDMLPWKLSPERHSPDVLTPAEESVLGKTVLPEAEKEKDRQLVRVIPQILSRAGYTVVKLAKR